MKRWKKALSCVLALVMAVCLLPVAALAADTVATTVSSEEALRAAVAAGGKIILDDDISLTENITVGTEVTINGNGHTIDAGAPIRQLIYVIGGGDLTLEDIILDGTNLNGSIIMLNNVSNDSDTPASPVVTLKDGAVLQNLTSGSGAIWCWKRGCTVNMLGGSISGNYIGVCFSGPGNFNMSGGSISGNSMRGVGMNMNGVFNMSGGSISGNGYADTRCGGGVNMISDGLYADINITGGRIENNVAGSFGADLAVIVSLSGSTSLNLSAEGLEWFYDRAGGPDGEEFIPTGDLVTETIGLRAVYTPKQNQSGLLLPAMGTLLPTLGSQVQSPFVDVTPVDYYYDAVNWAVDNGITTGTGRLSFSPDEPCTRAQAVTFLWRAAGSPAPKNAVTPFVDVDANAYYAKAVAWAVENGVTNGTSATTFSPDESCTRGQIVTFLYRAFGKRVSAAASFTDVAADAYYAPAVAWAAASGVTGGTGSGKFSPAATCTRAQIVTFLYRCCG